MKFIENLLKGKHSALIVTFMFSSILFAQTAKCEESDSTKAKILISGYVDAYYASYSDQVGNGNFQKFPSISPRSNQFGLNTAQVTAQYDAAKTRGIITVHFGDIAKGAWSATYNNIMEAHAGILLCKNVWLDAGFFRTHFGTEGLLPKENITSSVSVNTFYEPYFESGVRLSYTPNAKLTIYLYGLNTYGVYEENNNHKSFGALITYALSDKGNIGYSNYIGDDTPTDVYGSHTRIHQNVFLNYQYKKLKMQIGGDYCMQANSKITDTTASASMMSGVAALKYQLNPKYAVYGRFEWFSDPDGFMGGIIIDKQFKATGYKLTGITLGAEFKPTPETYLRLEGRSLQMDKNQEIFYWNDKAQSQRLEVLVNLGITF